MMIVTYNSVVTLSDVMLSAVMLNDVILSVVMLRVMAQLKMLDSDSHSSVYQL
jgi:hypothetical protein